MIIEAMTNFVFYNFHHCKKYMNDQFYIILQSFSGAENLRSRDNKYRCKAVNFSINMYIFVNLRIQVVLWQMGK